MDDTKKELNLSSDFNSKLKKSIKRNLLYKNILTITLLGILKSAMIMLDTVFSVFSVKDKKTKQFEDQ
ncbi:MAG: hypothetical protein MUO60_03945 [Clostridiaceae bacterium]|nr:hypothetical protein [Clostridiaceae bacterium]